MYRIFFVKSIFVIMLFFVFMAAPAMCLTPAEIQDCIDEGVSLDLNEKNLQLIYSSSSFNGHAQQDKRFIALLRAKLRVYKCIDAIAGITKRYDENLWVSTSGAVVTLLAQGGEMLSPVGLAGRAVDKIVRPLELEQLLLDLPRYYEAVVNTPDWEKKFAKISAMGSLDAGNIFHLAGFPEMESKDYYTNSLELQVESMELYEYDSSIEAWLYSFWLRRWKECNMEAARLAIEWLNKVIEQ